VHLHRLERIWLIFSVVLLVAFMATITTAALVDGFVPPSHIQSIDPTKVSQTPPFDKPGLRKIADGSYEAYYVAHVFAFDPKHLEVPLGAHVTFYVTSPDVEHGFSVPETSINMMVTPGWVSSLSYTFRTPGKFLLVCNEYCGSQHQMMAADIEVK
jgi:cytochrome c oxidase subunit 2